MRGYLTYLAQEMDPARDLKLLPLMESREMDVS